MKALNYTNNPVRDESQQKNNSCQEKIIYIHQDQFEITLNKWRDLDEDLNEKIVRCFGMIKYLAREKKVKGYTYFMDALGRSQDQVRRYFNKIEELGICAIKFKRSAQIYGKKHRNKLEFFFTPEGIQILGLQGIITPHSFAAPMRRSNIDNIENNIIIDLDRSEESKKSEIIKNEEVRIVPVSNVIPFEKNFPLKKKYLSAYSNFTPKEIEEILIKSGRDDFTIPIVEKIVTFMKNKQCSYHLFESRQALFNYAVKFVRGEKTSAFNLGQEEFVMLTKEEKEHHLAECEKEKAQRYAHLYRSSSPLPSEYQTHSSFLPEVADIPPPSPVQKDPDTEVGKWDESRSEIINLWGKAKANLRKFISNNEEKDWFSDVKIIEEEGKIKLISPSIAVHNKIKEDFARKLNDSFIPLGYRIDKYHRINKEGIVFEPINMEK